MVFLEKPTKLLIYMYKKELQESFRILQRSFKEFNGNSPTLRVMQLRTISWRQTMNAFRHAWAIIISSIVLLPISAYADGGFIVGASIGSASLDENFGGLTVDTDSSAYRISAGWRFNENFSIEAAYHDFGNFEQQLDINGTAADVSLSADGFTFGVAGSLPISTRFALTGRLGMFFWDGAAEVNNVSQASPEDSNLYFGAGASYSLTSRLAVTGDWIRYELEDAQSNVLSVGFQYWFGK
jgi:OOP family OmpA-OmpF porin